MTTDDRSILLATHRGDDAAARALWSRFSGRLLSYAAAVAPGAADDVVQRVFCTVLEQPAAQLAAVRDVTAWLVALTRREAITWLRRERRERARRAAAAPVPLPAPAGDPDLTAAVASLPRALREVLVLRHGAGLSLEQAAAALNANRNTVAWRYARAVERLRAQLNPDRAPTEVSHASR